MAAPAILKKSYDGIALFAVFNLLLMGGLIGYTAFSGVLSTKQVEQITAVLRGESLEMVDAQDEKQASDQHGESSTQASSLTSLNDIDSQTELEVIRREAERLKTELDQKVALVNSMMLRVTTEREAFRKEREAAMQEEQAKAQSTEAEGFQKQVEILEAVVPKVAVQHLLGMEDIDQAARVLLEMDTRKAKRLVEAAKQGNQLTKMRAILARVREAAPDRSDELEP